MGSAITFPLTDSGFSVRLWGTWLDDDIIDSCRRGAHPKLGLPLNSRVSTFRSEELEEAVSGVRCVFIAVSSEGFIPVFKRLIEVRRNSCHIFCLTKGFVQDSEKVMRISEWAAKAAPCYFKDKRSGWVSIGGPVKAVELSRKIPSASMYGIGSD